MEGPAPDDGRVSPAVLLAFGIAVVPFALLVWRFNFVYDDAYISFRYARNLVDGFGLCFNPGVEPPVEGYTNFLWTLWLAVFEWLRVPPTVWSRICSFSCALVLLWVLLRFAQRESRLTSLDTAGTALFFAALPPLAVWASGGLETMPFALAVFLTYERLASRHHGPRWLQAGLAAVAAALLRADGLVFVGIVLSALALQAALDKDRAVLRAAFQTGLLAAVATAGHAAWRYAYYQAVVPHTASTKVNLSGFTLGEGRDYVLENLLSCPAIALALLVSLAPLLAHRCRPGGRALWIALGVLAYTIVVGGDFMCFGRFIVPALPFVCLLVGRQLLYLRELTDRGTILATAWILALVGLSLPAAFDLHVVPENVRSRFRLVRFNQENDSQYKLWAVQKRNTEGRVLLGKALARHTHPGESIVRGAIGATGYYSGLFIYDQFGLVSREVGKRDVSVAERRATPLPPGHQKMVPAEFFRVDRPTYVSASRVKERGSPDGPCGRTAGFDVVCQYHQLAPDLVVDERRFLRLARAIYDGDE